MVKYRRRRYVDDESFTATTGYANAIELDLRATSDSVIHIKNMDGAIAVQYKIYATPKITDTIPADADDSWYNTLNSTNTPADYDHDTEVSIPAGVITREGLSNKYGWVRVQVKSTSGTPAVKLWWGGYDTA